MREKLLKLAEQKGNLPPLPEVLIRLERKIDDPSADLADISDLIKTEPVLSGRLIKLANSVFFSGGRDEARDLNSAVGRLGLKMVLDLAYTSELPQMFVKARGINQMLFWQHALGAAICAKAICKAAGGGATEQANFYMGGLMHDLGIMVFAYLIPDQYASFLEKVPTVQAPLHDLENKVFGIAHAELGARFIEKWWPVAPEIVKIVRQHHGNYDKNPSAVIAANIILNTKGITNGIKSYVAPQDEGFITRFGLDAEDLEEIWAGVEDALQQARNLLNR